MNVLVALEPTLDALGFAHTTAGNDRIVVVAGSAFTLTPGSHIVRQDGTEALQLVYAPIVRDRMYVDPLDLGRLLGVDVVVDGTRVSVAMDQPAGADATVDEVPIPRRHDADTRYASADAMPAPAATPAPVAFAGRIGVTLLNTAGNQSSLLSLQGAGGTVRGSIAAQSDGGASSLDGSIFLGDQHRSTTVGSIADPLGGSVFQSSGANGVALAREDGHLNYVDALRTNGVRTYAFEDRQLHGSSEFALLQGGGNRQALVGKRYNGARGAFVYSADAWVGTAGAAAGVTAKTTGRLFVAGTAAIASGALPLQTGDAPRELSLGYKLTPALTLSGGEVSALGIPLTTFGAATLRTGIGSFGISQSRAQTTFTASAITPVRFLALDFNRTDGSSSGSLNAGAALHRGAIEAAGQLSSDGSGDTTLQWRAARTGPSFVGGLERVWSDGISRLGAVVGVALPIFGGLSVEAAIHPLLHGNGLRITLVQDVIKHKRVPTDHLTLHVGEPIGTAQVWVDGAPFARIKSSDATVDVPAGSRSLSVRTLDGKLGSPTVNLTGRTTAPIALPMWPIRALRGRIVVEGGNPIDALVSLEHTIVTLESSEVVTESTADGVFEMQPQPIPPSAVLRIDENTLPDAFSAGPAVAVPADGEIVLTVHARRTVERKSF
jgi:hypothetical protein